MSQFSNTLFFGLSIFFIAFFILLAATGWKIFEKAGKPGWASLIPIYHYVVGLEIVGRPIWWLILFFIPVLNFAIWVVVSIDLAKRFGKSTLFGVLMVPFWFVLLPILAFGKAEFTPKPNT